MTTLAGIKMTGRLLACTIRYILSLLRVIHVVSPRFADLNRPGEIWGLKTFPSFPSCYYYTISDEKTILHVWQCLTQTVHASLSSVTCTPITREAVSNCLLLVSPKPCCASRIFMPLKLDWRSHGYIVFGHVFSIPFVLAHHLLHIHIHGSTPFILWYAQHTANSMMSMCSCFIFPFVCADRSLYGILWYSESMHIVFQMAWRAQIKIDKQALRA